MKRIYLYLLTAIALVIAGCQDRTSDLQLNGECDIKQLALDEYEGSISPESRTVLIRVPENYDAQAMTLTRLVLSEGATCNMQEGERLNMLTPKTLRVVNGNAVLDWSIQVAHDEARIYSFKLNGTYAGVINEAAKTITVFVPSGLELTALVPTITVSENATVSPASGIAQDFTQPVQYTVTNNSASAIYTVTVTAINKPHALYVGLPLSMDELNIEEQTACQWMLANVPNSLYASFYDIKNGIIDLSECEIIWWHYHKDGGVDGKTAFEMAASEAIEAQVVLREYYNRGGAFLFTRYATNLPAFIGAVKNEACPNNCWGQNENEAEKIDHPWSFNITGKAEHPLYQNLVAGSNPNEVYTCDEGYRITNSTAQWHIGADWGGYPTHEDWRNETGGTDLAWGGDGAIVVWEFPAHEGKGGIVCIGSGCYDWYSIDEVAATYHENVAKLTQNAINYLTNKE